jgi:hypothetical protein
MVHETLEILYTEPFVIGELQFHCALLLRTKFTKIMENGGLSSLRYITCVGIRCIFFCSCIHP